MLLSTALPQFRPAHRGRQGPGSHGHAKAKPAAMFPGSCVCFSQVSIVHRLHILAMAHPLEWNPVRQARKTIQDMEAAFAVGFDRFSGSGLEDRQAVLQNCILSCTNTVI